MAFRAEIIRSQRDRPAAQMCESLPNMLNELDQMASELNISRQAVIKMMLRRALDEHYLANRVIS